MHMMSKNLADELVTLRHANLKDNDGLPVVINIARSQAFAWYRAPDGSTFLVATGGGIVPILEKPEEVSQAIFKQPTKANKGRKKNGKK